MPTVTSAAKGAARGAALAALYFVFDGVGALLAAHALVDPSAAGALLVGVAASTTLAIGALAGAVAATVWPRRLRWRMSARLMAGGLAVTALIVTGLGYAFRVGRVVEPPQVRAPVTATRPLPILWVVVDTLRYDSALRMLSLKSLADQGLVFTDAESTAGWTVPSIATLITGIHGTALDASAGFIPDWAPTAAQHLRAAGYETRAVVDNVTIEPRTGFAAGFDSWTQRSAFRFAFTFPAFRLLPVVVRDSLREWLRSADEGAAGVTRTAAAILDEERDPGRPLFLYVHYMDPHAPYYPHPELDPPPPDAEPMSFYRYRDLLRADGDEKPAPAQLRWLRHRYDAEVESLDPQLGTLLSAWRRRYGGESVVLFTADHGEEFLDHGRLSHGVTVHREMVHVPLLLSLPRSVLPEDRGRRVIGDPVAHIDVLPTTLDAVGASPATPVDGPRIQGESWLPWLRGEREASSRPMVASHSRHGRRTYRFREDRWVYIKTMFYDRRPTEFSLYDLSTDPREETDLLALEPDVAAGMSRRFEPIAAALERSNDRDSIGANRASEESLRALGYIQ